MKRMLSYSYLIYSFKSSLHYLNPIYYQRYLSNQNPQQATIDCWRTRGQIVVGDVACYSYCIYIYVLFVPENSSSRSLYDYLRGNGVGSPNTFMVYIIYICNNGNFSNVETLFCTNFLRYYCSTTTPPPLVWTNTRDV